MQLRWLMLANAALLGRLVDQCMEKQLLSQSTSMAMSESMSRKSTSHNERLTFFFFMVFNLRRQLRLFLHLIATRRSPVAPTS